MKSLSQCPVVEFKVGEVEIVELLHREKAELAFDNYKGRNFIDLGNWTFAVHAFPNFSFEHLLDCFSYPTDIGRSRDTYDGKVNIAAKVLQRLNRELYLHLVKNR